MSDYHITICDDNVSFVHSIAAQCEKVMEKLHVPCSIKSLYSFEDVLRDYAGGGRTDLLFLDIMLGRKNGIELAQELKRLGCDSFIVLMTTERSYLLAGYSVQPLYFLIKPIDTGELEKAIRLGLKQQPHSASSRESGISSISHPISCSSITHRTPRLQWLILKSGVTLKLLWQEYVDTCRMPENRHMATPNTVSYIRIMF